MKAIEFDEWIILINKAIEYGITKEEVESFIKGYIRGGSFHVRS